MSAPTAKDVKTVVDASMGMMELLRPVEEAARGYMNELIRNGWDAELAAPIAAQLLIEWNASIFRGMGKGGD